MARGDYVVLIGQSEGGDEGVLGALEGRLRSCGWTLAGALCRHRLWIDKTGGMPVTTLPQNRGWILGEHHPMPDAPSFPQDRQAARGLVLARELSRARWGRFVAILPDGDTTVLYREPSGHRAAHVWSLVCGVRIVASDPTELPSGFSPPRLGLDWSRIGTFLANAGASTTDLLLSGLTSVEPGDALLLSGLDACAAAPVWRPADFAAVTSLDPEEAGRELVRRADACASAMARGHDRILMELSGGLDSAIVAASLGAVGEAGLVSCWLNFVGGRTEGDESRFATDVTERLGAALTIADLPLDPLTPADFAELGARLWPAVAGADAGRDRRTVAALESANATAVMSGQGGDAVFFQMPTALIFADAWRRDGLVSLCSSLLADVSRRTRTSAWAVLSDALRQRPRTATGQDDANALVTPEVREAAKVAQHVWVRSARAAGVPPGKALQILAIANCHVFHGESRRGRAADQLYPLLAQPVVELALGIGVPELAGGAYDRPFARRAFRERLPSSIVRRRAKGRLSVYFGHLVAASVEGLREYLLDGCLADAGLLDRQAMARILDPDQLVWAGRPAEVLRVAATEAWVRHWQTRAPDSVSTANRLG